MNCAAVSGRHAGKDLTKSDTRRPRQHKSVTDKPGNFLPAAISG
jgi:hypothetical protein